MHYDADFAEGFEGIMIGFLCILGGSERRINRPRTAAFTEWRMYLRNARVARSSNKGSGIGTAFIKKRAIELIRCSDRQRVRRCL